MPGNSIADKERIPLMRPMDKIFLGYFILLSFILAVRLGEFPDGKLFLWGHVVLIILFYSFLALSRRTKSKFVFFLRQWYPVIFYTMMYEEVGRLCHIIFPNFLDPFFVRIEKWIFAGHMPGLELQSLFPHPLIKEIMYFAYFSYYLLPFFVAVTIYMKRLYREFADAIFTVSLTFYFCYLFFIIFPVAGPRFVFPGVEMSVSSGFFPALVHLILENAEIMGGAFPSSHVAIALIVLFLTYKYIKKARIPVTIIVILLMISTVYGHFHYAVDVFAGIIVAVVFYLIAPRVRKLLGGESWIR